MIWQLDLLRCEECHHLDELSFTIWDGTFNELSNEWVLTTSLYPDPLDLRSIKAQVPKSRSRHELGEDAFPSIGLYVHGIASNCHLFQVFQISSSAIFALRTPLTGWWRYLFTIDQILEISRCRWHSRPILVHNHSYSFPLRLNTSTIYYLLSLFISIYLTYTNVQLLRPHNFFHPNHIDCFKLRSCRSPSCPINPEMS